MNDINFRDYYQITLNEETDSYLGHKVGDISNGINDLLQNYQGMGTRQINDNAEQIVNIIRRILHTHWPEEQERNLKNLQKVGVSIMKAIEEKGDLESVLKSSASEVQKTMEKLGVPINSIGTPDAEQSPSGKADGVGDPQHDKEPQDASQGKPASEGPSPAETPPGTPGVASPPSGGDLANNQPMQ
ncbi:MAG: hypothetical protein ACW99G_06050 [Candidatus Thorarchaeota archaeon]|jgi:hypothetical protein